VNNTRRLIAASQKADFVTAAGSAQTDATAITDRYAVVAGADGSVGVILPKVDPGDFVVVANPVNGALLVYPPSGQYINAGNQNAAFSQTALKNAVYVFAGPNGSGAERWHAILSA